jgi:hypothetical protein
VVRRLPQAAHFGPPAGKACHPCRCNGSPERTACDALAIPEQGKSLRRVVRGYFNYHAVPTNGRSAEVFRHHMTDLWRRTRRRSRRSDHVDTDHRAGECLGPTTDHPSSLAERSFRRHTPEVGAVCGKAALCLWAVRSHPLAAASRSQDHAGGRSDPRARM